jgi:hypothetical protein
VSKKHISLRSLRLYTIGDSRIKGLKKRNNPSPGKTNQAEKSNKLSQSACRYQQKRNAHDAKKARPLISQLFFLRAWRNIAKLI